MEGNEVYYKTVESIRNNIEKLFTADMARELTNNVLIEKIKNTLREIEKVAKEGKNHYSLVINNAYDFSFITDFFVKELGYEISKIETKKDCREIILKW